MNQMEIDEKILLSEPYEMGNSQVRFSKKVLTNLS